MAAKNNTAEAVIETPVPEGFAALRGGNCSFDGVEYTAVNGVVVVPVAAIQALIEHGFIYA